MYMPKSTDEVNAKFPLIELGSIALHGIDPFIPSSLDRVH